MDWGSLIAGVLALAGTLLKAWLDSRPQRLKEKRNEEIEKGREDLAGGNVASVEQRIDGMLRDLPQGDGTTGGQNGQAQGRATGAE